MRNLVVHINVSRWPISGQQTRYSIFEKLLAYLAPLDLIPVHPLPQGNLDTYESLQL